MDDAGLQATLDGRIAAAGVPGAVAALGDRDGVRATAAAGRRDPASGDPMTAGTMFQIASMTKAVASVAAMQLVERGRLELDAPVAALLPGLADPQVIDGFDGDTPRFRPARRPITLRHLLTHTSGLGYDFVHADLTRSRGGAARTPGTFASIAPPLLCDPGERWEYGVSTDWVGLAVEAASGQSLDAYLANHVTGPLGMTDTMFDLDGDRLARLAAMQLRGPDGAMSAFPTWIGGGRDAEFRSAGGGLSSTAGDYLRFLRMLLRGGELDGTRILDPATVATMGRNQIGPLRAGAMATAMPAFSHPVDVFPDQATGWGLGFAINPEPGPNGRAAGSLAWAGIANCYYWLDSASGLAGVVLMQFLPFGDPQALDVYAGIERYAYGRS